MKSKPRSRSRGEARDRAGDQRDDVADIRDTAGDERDRAGDQRDDAADARDDAGDQRDRAGDQRDDVADIRDTAGNERDRAGDRRDDAADARDDVGAKRDAEAGRRDLAAERRDSVAEDGEARARPGTTPDDTLERAAHARSAAASDREQASLDRQAGTSERDLAERDRGTALADRGAGARERADAEEDRGSALNDRGAGATERTSAGRDRDTALADRGAGAKERADSEHDRDVALVDRDASAGERGFAERDRGTSLADRGAGARDRSAAERDRLTVERDVQFRAHLAVDNARMYARQRSFSEDLQRSLLTAPPQSEHFQIAARYVAATHEEEVGGDWYNAFVVESGETVIAIGDVMGHDIHAAIAMAHIRGLLRGIGYTTGDGPAALLGRLDSAVQGLGIESLATVIIARLEYHHGDVEYGRARLRWSNAGHPPGLVIDPSGDVRMLAGEADLMLGVDDKAERHETTSALAPGCTVLMYTDGLVERRDLALADGIAALVAVVGSLAGKPLDDLCDEVLAARVPESNEDDVALLAVRVLDARG